MFCCPPGKKQGAEEFRAVPLRFMRGGEWGHSAVEGWALGREEGCLLSTQEEGERRRVPPGQRPLASRGLLKDSDSSGTGLYIW